MDHLLLLFIVALLLLELKTRRPDGRLLSDPSPAQRLALFRHPSPTGATVRAERSLPAEPLERYLGRTAGAFGADRTAATLAAASIALARDPALRRFVVGHRIYQRDLPWVTAAAPVVGGRPLKLRLEEGETFSIFCLRLHALREQRRAGPPSRADEAAELLNSLPRFALRVVIAALRRADYYNLLPASLLEDDPLHTACLVVDEPPGGAWATYPLPTWGTCPLLLALSAIRAEPGGVDGAAGVARRMTLSLTWDARVIDGAGALEALERAAGVLEDPFTRLGCLEEGDGEAPPLRGLSRSSSAPDAGATTSIEQEFDW